MDQANNLRNLLNKNQDKNDNRTSLDLSSRVITVTSGKGGVGKTNFSINLAIQFSKLNKKVILIDADFGLANVEVLFGIMPKYNLADVLSGEKDIEEVLTNGPMGVKFLSGGSGLKELSNISEHQMAYFISNFSYLDAISDIIIIDTGAGISRSVINFIKASDETIVVTTPEPTSITDAYALVKTITYETINIPKFKLVVNRVDDDAEGEQIYNKLNNATNKFLNIKLESLGCIPYDNLLVKAVKRQEPVNLTFPDSEFSRALQNISYKLLDIDYSVPANRTGIKGFMKKFINYINN